MAKCKCMICSTEWEAEDATAGAGCAPCGHQGMYKVIKEPTPPSTKAEDEKLEGVIMAKCPLCNQQIPLGAYCPTCKRTMTYDDLNNPTSPTPSVDKLSTTEDVQSTGCGTGQPTQRVDQAQKKLSVPIDKLAPYWRELQRLEDNVRREVMALEREMGHSIGLGDMEFIMVDGGYVGIGNTSRTMGLVHDSVLNKAISVNRQKGGLAETGPKLKHGNPCCSGVQDGLRHKVMGILNLYFLRYVLEKDRYKLGQATTQIMAAFEDKVAEIIKTNNSWSVMVGRIYKLFE